MNAIYPSDPAEAACKVILNYSKFELQSYFAMKNTSKSGRVSNFWGAVHLGHTGPPFTCKESCHGNDYR